MPRAAIVQFFVETTAWWHPRYRIRLSMESSGHWLVEDRSRRRNMAGDLIPGIGETTLWPTVAEV